MIFRCVSCLYICTENLLSIKLFLMIYEVTLLITDTQWSLILFTKQ